MADNEDIKSDDIADDKDKTPKKRASKKKSDEARVNNSITINPKLVEAVSRTVVFSFGRMNPVTIGHEKLVNKVLLEAKKNNATPVVYLSHSQDPKKNPLSYNDKVSIAQKAFGKVIKNSNAKTIIQVMQELDKTFDKAILIVGADRVTEFETLLNRYNGKDYNFSSITVMSAGERDPDAEGVEGMSASKMRAAAASGDKDAFISGLPKKLQRNGEDVYDMVRSGMKLAEELDAEGLLSEAVLNFAQRRKRALVMRKYKGKIAAARRRMMKRPATPEKIKIRAKKKAIAIVKAKIAGKKGADYSSLSSAEKQMIDKKIEKRKALIQRIAKRIAPKIRLADRERLSGAKKVNEAFELFLETPEEILKKQHKQERINLSKEHERESDSLKAREMRLKIRDLKKDDNKVEETVLLSLIDKIVEDIDNSIFEDELKAYQGLKAKAEKHDIPLEVIESVYETGVALWNEEINSTPQQMGYASVNSYIANLKEEVDLNSFFDLNEQFELMESSILDKALAAIHKHVNLGKDLGDISYQVSRAADVNFSGRELAKKYIEKFGAPKNKEKSNPEIRAKLMKKYGFKSEQFGAGFEGTDTLVQNYKNDTPGESGSKKTPKIGDWSPLLKDQKAKKINEDFDSLLEDAQCALISQKDIRELEKFADELLKDYDIDIEFTKHFGERMSDDRNNPCITIAELKTFFRKIYANKAMKIRGNVGIEAVLKDVQRKLNMPVIIDKNRQGEIEVRFKTIMRKQNFTSPNRKIEY